MASGQWGPAWMGAAQSRPVPRHRQQVPHSEPAPVTAAAQLPHEALQLLLLLLRQLLAEDADGDRVLPAAQGLVHLQDAEQLFRCVPCSIACTAPNEPSCTA